MLNDKQHINDQRDRYRTYETVVDEVPIATGQSSNQGNTYLIDEYDDEYDDTYDINQVGANDLDEDDELLNRRYGIRVTCARERLLNWHCSASFWWNSVNV